LKIGVTFASFSVVGNVPRSTRLMRNVICAAISSAPSLITVDGILSLPDDFDGFSDLTKQELVDDVLQRGASGTTYQIHVKILDVLVRVTTVK